MKKIKLLLVCLSASLAFMACDPNDDDNNSNNPGDFAENFGPSASRNFIGQVVDTDNNPILNATVKIGTTAVQTDSHGVFIINNASVNENFAFITAKKAGYLDGSRSMVPTTGKNQVKIMLIPATPIQSIASGVESEVSLSSGTKITFDGAFRDENGAAYSGNVTVYAYHLKPSNENLNSLMPGMLYAENENGDERYLETFGMLNVELRGAGGQKLNIANGHTAAIEVKIDDSQLGSAPSSIPLWHFDDVNGYWKQEGSATKQGSFYKGEVSHFSWWNCDAEFPTVNLCLKLVDEAGNPLSNTFVSLTMGGISYDVFAVSDNNGQICGLVPANETLTMKIYDNCTNVISTTTVGPFTADTTLPDIVVSGVGVASTLVQGNLVQCNNANVTDGYVMLSYGGQNRGIVAVTNGAFSFTTLICDDTDEFTLEGFDFVNLQTTGVINYTFTTPVTNVGNLSACNAVTEFITYQIDSNPPVYLIGQVDGGLDAGIFASAYNMDQNGLYIYGSSMVPGIYTTAEFSIESGVVYIHSGITNDVVFNVSNVGPVGGYIDLTFNGTYTDSLSVTRTITGVAHVIRNN